MPDLKVEKPPRIRCHVILTPGYIIPCRLSLWNPSQVNLAANQNQEIPERAQFPSKASYHRNNIWEPNVPKIISEKMPRIS